MSGRKLTNKRAKLLAELAEIVGGNCYNGNIQNYGPGGIYEGQGRSFQYSLTYLDEKGDKRMMKYPTRAELSAQEISTGHFVFGANHLRIVRALDQVVTHLEEKHGLSL